MERKRTKFNRDNLPDKVKLSDAIYRKSYEEYKEKGYIQTLTEMARSKELTLAEKGILNILLSNKNGEWISSVADLENKVQESAKVINKALTGLKKKGYLKFVRYRDMKTKQIKGLFWAYTDTPNVFDYHKNLGILKKLGFEVVPWNKTQLTDNQLRLLSPERGKGTTNKRSLRKKTNEGNSDEFPSNEDNKKPLPPFVMFYDDKYVLRPKSKKYVYHNEETDNYEHLPDECYPEGYDPPKQEYDKRK